MAEVTDEAVEKRINAINELREQVVEAQTEASTVFKSRDNELTMAALDKEEARLKADLKAAQAVVESVDAAVEAQIEAIQTEGGTLAVEEEATTTKGSSKSAAKE